MWGKSKGIYISIWVRAHISAWPGRSPVFLMCGTVRTETMVVMSIYKTIIVAPRKRDEGVFEGRLLEYVQ